MASRDNLTPAGARDAYLEPELLHEARLEDGLEARNVVATEFRERGLELGDGHGVDLGLGPLILADPPPSTAQSIQPYVSYSPPT